MLLYYTSNLYSFWLLQGVLVELVYLQFLPDLLLVAENDGGVLGLVQIALT